MKIGWYRIGMVLACAGPSLFAATTQYKFSEAGNYPGAYRSFPLAANGRHIVGYYESGNAVNGYIQEGSKFKDLFPPGNKGSYVGGINRRGAAVGGFCPNGCNPNTGQHGFLHDHGVYTQIDYPSGVMGSTTTAFGINDQGQIVGGYCLPPSNVCPTNVVFSPANHGFLDDHGVFTQLDYPGAQYTEANAINNAGSIVGNYFINNSAPHAYLYQNGVYINIDVPDANLTFVSAINNLGVAAGNYQDHNFYVHGFLYQNGTFTTVDVLKATVSNLNGLDDAGEIVGIWSNVYHEGNLKGVPTGSLP